MTGNFPINQNPLLNNGVYKQNSNNNYFHTNNYAANASVFDSYEQTSNKSTESTILENDFKEVQANQGFIGKVWNGIKNVTGIGLSSKDVEAKIQQYKNGEITYEEAMQSLDSYEQKQKDGVNILTNAISGIVTGLIAIGTGGIGLSVIGAGAAIGAGSKVALKTIDRATNDVEGDVIDLKQMAKDTMTGAVDGAINVATGGMIGKVGSTLTQTIVNGAIQGAKAGAISGAAGGATEYAADVITGDREFSASEFATTTISSAAMGGAFGGVVGGITGGIRHKGSTTPDTPDVSNTPDTPNTPDASKAPDTTNASAVNDIQCGSKVKTATETPIETPKTDKVQVAAQTKQDVPETPTLVADESGTLAANNALKTDETQIPSAIESSTDIESEFVLGSETKDKISAGADESIIKSSASETTGIIALNESQSGAVIEVDEVANLSKETVIDMQSKGKLDSVFIGEPNGLKKLALADGKTVELNYDEHGKLKTSTIKDKDGFVTVKNYKDNKLADYYKHKQYCLYDEGRFTYNEQGKIATMERKSQTLNKIDFHYDTNGSYDGATYYKTNGTIETISKNGDLIESVANFDDEIKDAISELELPIDVAEIGGKKVVRKTLLTNRTTGEEIEAYITRTENSCKPVYNIYTKEGESLGCMVTHNGNLEFVYGVYASQPYQNNDCIEIYKLYTGNNGEQASAYRGIGTELVKQAIIDSYKDGHGGRIQLEAANFMGGNSRAEAFYSHIGMSNNGTKGSNLFILPEYSIAKLLKRK